MFQRIGNKARTIQQSIQTSKESAAEGEKARLEGKRVYAEQTY
jgi:hypothetical protein